jgi:hypothetical protein
MGTSGLLPGSAAVSSSIFGLLVGALAVVVVLALIGIFVIVVVANRADPDVHGRRPFTVYLFGVAFVTLWSAVIGATGIVLSLVRLIGTTRASGPGLHPVGDAVARDVVLSAIVLVVSVAILAVHLGKGLEYARADGAAGPSARVAQTYVAAVAFVSVLALVVIVVAVVYSVFQLVAPGVFGAAGGRSGAGRTLIDTVYVSAVLGIVLVAHHRLVPPGIEVLDVLTRRRRAGGNAVAPGGE